MSGLRTMKRSWSGPSHDILDKDDAGVVSTKVKGSSEHARGSFKHQALTTNAMNKMKDYDDDDDFEKIASNMPLTPEGARDAPSDRTATVNMELPRGSLLSTGQSVRQSLSADEPSSSSSHSKHSRAAQEQQNARNEQDLRMKRQLPSSFYKSSDVPGDKAQRMPWSKSASDLRSNSEKLNFLVKGTPAPKSGLGSVEPARNIAKIFLAKEQQVVYDRVISHGKSIFFTGSAGTGKSVVLREIIQGLRRKYGKGQDAVAICASTGIAACHIGGTTLHAFAGAGLCNDSVDKLVSKVKKNRKSSSRWMRTQVLIVDEISMISPDFLDKLEEMARILRRSQKPFGGIKLVLCGDFFQLPPVERGSMRTRYAFDAKCWDSVIEEKINLTQVFRQKDPKFVNMLNEIRFGKVSPETVRLFSSLTGESKMQREAKMAPTILYPTRKEVEQANAIELIKIKRPAHTYHAEDGGELLGEDRARQLENFLALPRLNLKMGCQVMLIKNNLDDQLVNGSTGRVLAFLTQAEWTESLYGGYDWDSVDPEQMTEEDVLTSIKSRYVEERQKDAGKTMSELSEQTIPTEGRLNKSSDASGMSKSRADLVEMIRKEERRERSRSRSASPERREVPRLPVVRFFVPHAASANVKPFRTTIVSREVWKTERPSGEILASRTQIPLILAWSLSCHKAQGQSIPILKVNLDKIFEKGQAYVALSRSVSLDGLQVLGFKPSTIRADQRVVEWYKSLSVIQ